MLEQLEQRTGSVNTTASASTNRRLYEQAYAKQMVAMDHVSALKKPTVGER